MISTIPKFQELLGKAISRTLLLAFLRKSLSKKKKSLENPKQAKEGAVNFCQIHLSSVVLAPFSLYSSWYSVNMTHKPSQFLYSNPDQETF